MENLFMIHVPLPDTIAGIRVITTDHSIKPKVMTENDLFFYNLSLQIDGTYVFVSIVVLEKSRNSFAVYKGGDYHFRYEWQPEQRNYELDLVGEGSMWMEGPGEKGFFKRIFRRNNSPK